MNVRSNEPFWLIVGSGITGSLMAHSFIERGYQTVVIDKREIANGSSSATTSMLQYEIDVPLSAFRKWVLLKISPG